jgi:glycosyltransferase involved in cell wall biosynthesis
VNRPADTAPSGDSPPEPAVSLLLVTKDAADLLPRFLRSLEAPTAQAFELVVNDDPSSTDDLEEVLRAAAPPFPVALLRENVRVSQGRRRAAQVARGRHLWFLDADMIVVPGLLDECVALCAQGADAVVVTEEQVVRDWWSQCKWLDKRLARGSDLVESARFFPADVYWRVGGHDESLSFGEDKDLDCRVRDTGAVVQRTAHAVLHDDGAWTLGRQFRRGAFWGSSMARARTTGSQGVRIQSSVLWRIRHYVRRRRTIARHPLLFGGLAVLRGVEVLGAGVGRWQVRRGASAPRYVRR